MAAPASGSWVVPLADINLEDLFKSCDHMWTESSTCVRCGKPEGLDPFSLMPDIGPAFEARFNSHCSKCGQTIEAGQQARFEEGKVVHVKCPERRKACTVCWLVHGTHQEECE